MSTLSIHYSNITQLSPLEINRQIAPVFSRCFLGHEHSISPLSDMNPSQLVLVAKIKGVVAGYAIFSATRASDPKMSEFELSEQLTLRSIAVLPKYQRLGIGRELITLGIDSAIAADYRALNICFERSEDNIAAKFFNSVIPSLFFYEIDESLIETGGRVHTVFHFDLELFRQANEFLNDLEALVSQKKLNELN
jgi:ribosomal protein S18 acetylase RimI-like enzyme